jgi:hypothetical protein
MRSHLLDFTLVDDVTLALADCRDAICEAVLTARVERIGPLSEYLFQQVARPDLLPPLTASAQSQLTTCLQAILDCGRFDELPHDSCLEPKEAEFSWAPTDQAALDDPRWIAFCKRFDRAAQRARFSRTVAAGLTGALGEMVDNVLLHSGKPESAIVGYSSVTGSFEYVVADAGIGVLGSLRRNSEYHHLTDAGTALQTALTEGESRFGRASGHGLGFRQVFLSLASLQGSLRFRSGDHSLELDGMNPCLSTAELMQRSYFQGFMISVSCHC